MIERSVVTNRLIIFLCPIDCLHQYLKQPPSGLQCNPYSKNTSLKIECVASIPATDAPRTEIIWLYNNSRIMNTSFATLDRITEEWNDTDSDVTIVTSRITFREGDLNEAYRGNYSCQLMVDDDLSFASPTPPLVLEGELAYIQEDPCIVVQTEEPGGIVCAGNIVNTVTTELVKTTSVEPTPFTSSFSSSPFSSFSSSSITSSPSSSFFSFPPSSSDSTTSQFITVVTKSREIIEGSTSQTWGVYVLLVITAVFMSIVVLFIFLSIGIWLSRT